MSAQCMVSKKLYRLLLRTRAGECPRSSHKDYDELCELPYLGDALQLESALGADTRAGWIITALHSTEHSRAMIDKLFKEYALVDENGDKHSPPPSAPGKEEK